MPLSRIPIHDRPRERLAASGAHSLSDRELLALLLGTAGVAGIGVHDLAERLLTHFGSVEGISRATLPELTSIKGIGDAKASGIVAAFELARRAAASLPPARIKATSDVVAITAPLLRGRCRERLLVVSCDVGGRVLGVDCVSDGAADHTLLPVREIMVAVLKRDGRQFALAHNHPSSDPTPSTQDIRGTAAVQEAAGSSGLRFLDHVIVTDAAWRRVTTSQ
ncbi:MULTISPECIES: RadC family protein [Micromonospora]|uniref:DNA repair protein RadC n=1 Tax=Micromonospora solifontis TaxID=2487138 RepID=A0ABX9W973_9ACTN|nr:MULTISPECIES: DNA repair protein RadC [Micromonospora]NES13368.1 DNA repair protein RadC [Micromonospora sp. PPF5-17B]NES39705.1 DNA repair protein RadC [Micromonospora solifontis]NES59154.1 DNA repair protein RadC [Micromonospora sp. PPF5-6]RNL86723.1 DNA repair protein RadC [Micromonospora solifontis]